MKLKNFRIATRLGMAFTAVLLLTFALMAVAVIRLHEVGNATAEMERAKDKADLAALWHSGNMANDGMTEARLRALDPQDTKLIDDKMKAKSAEITEVKEKLTALISDEEGKRLLAKIADARVVYMDVRKQVFALRDGGQSMQQVSELIEQKMKPTLAAYDVTVANLAERQQRVFDETKVKVDQTVASSRTILLAVGSAALVVGALLAYLLSRSITRPLREAVEVARTVAAGDLSRKVEVHSADETGQLMEALKSMTDNLNRIVARVRAGTDTIATGSAEIAAGNQDLSARTEQQAGALEETASSMEELTSTVQQNAENAHQGNELAARASEIAIEGGSVVSQVVETMGAINDSAHKIEDIISVIEGIAFQTNILALNAAVEAARAGEQGRGFAVVASEVRNLAQRSAAAAKEIKTLIDDSVGKVEVGSRLVNQAGRTIQEVVGSVQRVSSIMAQIASASKEQSDGIEQVNQAIGQMDQVTQQNAALVEEAAAAAASMREQATSLAEAVSIFKIDGLAVQPVAAPAPAVKPAVAVKPAPAAAVPARPRLELARQQQGTPARREPAMAGGDGWEQF
jgi:methyl-accepting chemotaxis protein